MNLTKLEKVGYHLKTATHYYLNALHNDILGFKPIVVLLSNLNPVS